MISTCPHCGGPLAIAVGELTLDLMQRRAYRRGRDLNLVAREFELLKLFATNPGKPFTRLDLVKELRGYDFDPETNAEVVHINRLRKKMDQPFDWPMLLTLRGVGYFLRGDNES